MYQAADTAHCLWMPLSLVQGGQVVMCCCAHARWDGVFLLSHYIFFFIEWVLLYVFVRCCVVQDVYARFSQVEPITTVSVLHTSCNGWSKPSGTAVRGSACDKMTCPSQCPCTAVPAASCEKLLKYSVFSKASPKSSAGVWVLPLHTCVPPSLSLSTPESHIT